MIEEEVEVMILKIWYLLYYVVLNFNKFGKVCVVFDVVFKFDGVFLNDKFLIGFDLLNDLVGILMRFCIGKIGIMVDIE